MEEAYKKVLIYKRTHRGDPGPEGVFGIHDCMGSVRAWEYDAVIGVGGVRPWSGDECMAGRVTWVGIGPKKYKHKDGERGPLVTFENYSLLDCDGPFLEKIAPNLHKYMYKDAHRRLLMSDSLTDEIMQREVEVILDIAKDSASSIAFANLDAVKDEFTKNKICGCQ